MRKRRYFSPHVNFMSNRRRWAHRNLAQVPCKHQRHVSALTVKKTGVKQLQRSYSATSLQQSHRHKLATVSDASGWLNHCFQRRSAQIDIPSSVNLLAGRSTLRGQPRRVSTFRGGVRAHAWRRDTLPLVRGRAAASGSISACAPQQTAPDAGLLQDLGRRWLECGQHRQHWHCHRSCAINCTLDL
jgi:hypothetical protein